MPTTFPVHATRHLAAADQDGAHDRATALLENERHRPGSTLACFDLHTAAQSAIAAEQLARLAQHLDHITKHQREARTSVLNLRSAHLRTLPMQPLNTSAAELDFQHLGGDIDHLRQGLKTLAATLGLALPPSRLGR